MFERYNEEARRALFVARYDASRLGSITIEIDHLLLGLIHEGKGITGKLFARARAPLDDIRNAVEADAKGRHRLRLRLKYRSRKGPSESSCVRRRRPIVSCTSTSAPNTCSWRF